METFSDLFAMIKTNATNLSNSINSTNITKILKRVKKHANYVGEPRLFENCYRPYNYEEDIESACDFVLNEGVCSWSVVFVNYLKILVCHFQLKNDAIGVMAMIVFALIGCVLFFTAAFVITRYFLYPNTVALINRFKLKKFIIGTVVISIIRRFPKSVSDGGVCHSYTRAFALKHAEILGRFIVDFLIGLTFICIAKPLRVDSGVFLRDIVLIACGVTFIHINLLSEMYNLFLPPVERAQPMIVYSSYLCIIVYMLYVITLIVYPKIKEARRSSSILSVSSAESFDSDEYPYEDYNPTQSHIDPANVFFMNISPMANIRHNYTFVKFLLAPFFIIVAVLVPVVRHDRELHGWNKFLFCFSVIPVLLFITSIEVTIDTIVATYISAFIFICLVYFLTNSQRIPKYHDHMTIWNMLLGTALICLIENEMKVFVTQLLTYFFNWNDDALYLFWFPFNSIWFNGLYIFILAQKGYHDIAFDVVMGSMIYTVYSSLPSMTLGVCFHVNKYFLITPSTETAFVFVYIVIVTVLVSVSLSSFILRCSHAVYFACLIVVFFIYITLSNSFVIHPYGTIHAEELHTNVVHSNWA